MQAKLQQRLNKLALEGLEAEREDQGWQVSASLTTAMTSNS